MAGYYNFAIAFVACGVAFVIGEMVSHATKAWIPSVFVTACVMLFGYWTIFPKEIVTNAGLLPFGNTIGIFLLLVHIGTIISLKQLMKQWRTVVICLCGLLGMCVIGYFVGSMVMERNLVIAGIPPLTGGIVSTTIMQKAAMKAGLMKASVFAIATYCIQGFAGYPLTAACLHFEGKRLLHQLRSKEVVLTPEQIEANSHVGITATADDSETRKTLLPPLPKSVNTPVMILTKLGLVGWFSLLLGKATPVNGAIWALVLGVFFTYIGFLDQNALTRAGSLWITMFALLMFVFDGLKICTPDMLVSLLAPMVILVVVSVVGMALFSYVISHFMKVSFPLAFANSLTALYGFPADAILTEMTCSSLADNEVEKGYLMANIFPSMIVGGFTSVTITSVLIAGYFSTLF
ncbi:hypothetical protein [Acidaminococcus timonensis]|uniref:hypothetical protein n=1 Tax=Acidaminococcus timonensis TaxID=1871002 RepID=UPI0008DAD9CA|nr:hypothetical protein [Acidaminococcus timonensis]